MVRFASSRRQRAWLLLPSLLLLLLLVVVATRGGSAVPTDHGLNFLGSTAKAHTSTAPVFLKQRPALNPILGIGLSATIALALLALLLGLLGVFVVLASLRWYRRRVELAHAAARADQGAAMDIEIVQTLLQGTRFALTRLRGRAGGPPGDAVQEAWLALETAAAESGTARRPEQTPTEFTAAVLADHAVDPVALATLRGLYQRARFGPPASITEADAATASTALDRIAETLGAAVGSTPAGAS